MKKRMEELRVEYRRGLEELAKLEGRRTEVQRTLLRISGAIQVLEELTATEASAAGDGDSLEPCIQAVAR